MAMNPKLLRPRTSSTAAPPAPSDPFFSDVSLLLHFDGTNGSTTFTDSSLNGFAVTADGTPEISTSESQFGGASCYFDGGSTLTAPQESSIVGTGDFTAEAWVFPASDPTGVYIWIANDEAGGLSSPIHTDGTVLVGRSLIEDIGQTTNSVTFGAWNHIAITRVNSVGRIFINGEVGWEGTLSADFVSGVVRIGADDDGAYGLLQGYIDELRLSNVARYTANFTPPGAPFPDQ